MYIIDGAEISVEVVTDCELRLQRIKLMDGAGNGQFDMRIIRSQISKKHTRIRECQFARNRFKKKKTLDKTD